MAIPSTPLVVNFDADNITLDEMCLFEEFNARGLRAFLAAHTSWTLKEVGALTLSELKDVTTQLGAKIKELSIPLANPPRSGDGRA